MTNSHQTTWLFISVSCLLLIACTNPTGDRAALDKPWGQASMTSDYDPVRLPSRHDEHPPRAVATAADPDTRPATRSEIYRGSGNFVKLGQASQTPVNTAAPGDITLNFQGSDIAEVVKTVLGDILQLNYSLDERVRGQVYLQTNTPIREEALLPTLESLLQTHGAALVHSNGLYTVVPASEVPTSALNPQLTTTAERGYQMLILPLRYIGAREMEKILEPVKPRQGAMMVDDRRNMLTLVGSRDELVNIRDTVNLFDVDQLRGMSVGLFRLQASSADVIASELQAIFGDQAEGPLAGMVRYLPIERLNALLVITPQERYLTDARVWIERLDRAENPRGLNMYVYHVQNGKADHLATLLNQLFDSQRRNSAGSSLPPEDGAPLQIATGINAANLDVGEVSVIADTERNALVVMAASADYQKVE